MYHTQICVQLLYHYKDAMESKAVSTVTAKADGHKKTLYAKAKAYFTCTACKATIEVHFEEEIEPGSLCEEVYVEKHHMECSALSDSQATKHDV